MNSTISGIRARIILALIWLGLASNLAACQNHDRVVIIQSPPLSAVAVDVTPDSTIFTWNLTGGGISHTGTGDTVLAGVSNGEYTITWDSVPGFYSPVPVSESKTVARGGRITFTGLYSLMPPETTQVLFLGSSYFGFNNLPELFRSIAELRGKELIIEANIPSGYYLDYHVMNPTSINLMKSRDWDVVVLQGVGRIVAYPRTSPFNLVNVLKNLERIIHNNCSTTEIMFCMPWAFEDGMLWTPGGTDDYFDMQQRIYDNTLTYPGQVDIVIAPVGWAWNRIMMEQPPLHYLFLPDWNHPSFRGSYLMACTIFASIYRESVENTPYTGGVPLTEILHFQAVASRIVLNNLGLWELD